MMGAPTGTASGPNAPAGHRSAPPSHDRHGTGGTPTGTGTGGAPKGTGTGGPPSGTGTGGPPRGTGTGGTAAEPAGRARSANTLRYRSQRPGHNHRNTSHVSERSTSRANRRCGRGHRSGRRRTAGNWRASVCQRSTGEHRRPNFARLAPHAGAAARYQRGGCRVGHNAIAAPHNPALAIILMLNRSKIAINVNSFIRAQISAGTAEPCSRTDVVSGRPSPLVAERYEHASRRTASFPNGYVRPVLVPEKGGCHAGGTGQGTRRRQSLPRQGYRFRNGRAYVSAVEARQQL